MTTTTYIKGGWEFKERNTEISLLDELHSKEGWIKTQKGIPSDIYVELKENGRIHDPFIGFNEQRVQWVAERDWVYRAVFEVGEKELEGVKAQLVFEGLDTFCEVYLNEKSILVSENMFQKHVVSVTEKLVPGQNKLLLHFESAKVKAKELEKQYGGVRRAGSCNLGDPSRLYVRKAQYHWRWDWGPELLSVGPWRPISLKLFKTSIKDICVRAHVDEDLIPRLTVNMSLEGDLCDVLRYDVSVSRVNTILLVQTGTTEGSSEVNVVEDKEINAELWWPTGSGSQPLYDVEVALVNNKGEVLDKSKKRVGFRRVQLIQKPLKEADQYGKGTTFFFEINNRPIYMGGSNWVPADSFLTTITPERYRSWLQLLKDGNQNMVRVWGGGIYEDDAFFEICDELGLLVWHDFQFACGVYPAHEDFVENVRSEAWCNVQRLRHHPCIALWCGNNEDYQMVLQWSCDGISELPAKLLYEDILPSVVETLCGEDVPYWFGSPYGGQGWDTADPTVGDVHQWDIWGGKGFPWQNYDVMGGRFVSEFGIPAMPDIRTIDSWMTPDLDRTQRYTNSPIMAQHNRAGSHEQRFAVLLNENFRVTSDLESYAFLTQVLQSEAVSFAYRSWRREWRGAGKEYNGGTLIWQSNDCWPVTSWAIADYFMRAKPAYYTIARELRPVTVGILRKVEQNRTHDRPRQFYEFGAFQSTGATMEVWATNSTTTIESVVLQLRYFDLSGNWRKEEIYPNLTLAPNQSTELITQAVPHRKQTTDDLVCPSSTVVIQARILDGDKLLATYCDWPQPFRYLDFPDPGLVVTRVREDLLRIRVTNPIKCLVLSVREGEEEVKWSDNALDIFPDDECHIKCIRLGNRDVWAAWMGQEQALKVL